MKPSSFDRVWGNVRRAIPFTALSTARRCLDSKSKSILDVGCGQGEPMGLINVANKYVAVAVDIFQPYLRECRERKAHSAYVLADIRSLPFRDKSFDTVLCLEVLEHLDKEEGRKLLSRLELVACRQVILSTPVGVTRQDEALMTEGNPFQAHRSGWQPTELRSLGYGVRGSTIRCLGGRAGTINCPRTLRPLGYLLWLVASPLVYFFPELAADAVCVKYVGAEKSNVHEI